MNEKEAVMELKCYLNNLRYLKMKEDDIKEYRYKIEKMTRLLSDIPKAKGVRHGLEDSIARLIELENEHREMYLYINEKRLLCEKKINMLNQPKKM